MPRDVVPVRDCQSLGEKNNEFHYFCFYQIKIVTLKYPLFVNVNISHLDTITLHICGLQCAAPLVSRLVKALDQPF